MRFLRAAVCLAVLHPVLPNGFAPIARAAERQFSTVESLTVREGETSSGDLYVWTRNADIAGLHDGDLLGGGESLLISGEVNGDIFFFGNRVEITEQGKVRDSVRCWTYISNFNGEIEGDLVAGAYQLTIHSRAHITGNVHIFAGVANIEGTIDGELNFTGGQITVGGTIGKDANIEADAIGLLSDARIGGDLNYNSRHELDQDLAEIVAGQVNFEETVDKPKKREPLFFARLLWWWYVGSALLVGLLAVALFRRAAQATIASIGTDRFLVPLVGLGISLVVPAASVLALVLVVSLPLGVISLLLFLVALYVAKVPVAIWLGELVLRQFGQTSPSPFFALALGILPLYLLFEIPYLGNLLWLGTIWLGLGAMVLAVRHYVQERSTPG